MGFWRLNLNEILGRVLPFNYQELLGRVHEKMKRVKGSVAIP